MNIMLNVISAHILRNGDHLVRWDGSHGYYVGDNPSELKIAVVAEFDPNTKQSKGYKGWLKSEIYEVNGTSTVNKNA